MAFPDTPRAYDAIAEKFDAGRTEVLREKKYIDLACAGIPSGAKVLDLGCGTGRPIARYLLDRGYALTGIDASAAMLALARRHVPGARLIHGRMEEVELYETFALAVVWDSLFHVPREHHATLYQSLACWIEPGGALLLSSGGTEDAGFTSEMHGETFFYSSWAPETVQGLLEAAGFDVVLREVDDSGSRGHVAIVARRTG